MAPVRRQVDTGDGAGIVMGGKSDMDDEMAWSVEETDAGVVLEVRGELIQRTSVVLDKMVRKLLLDRGLLLVEVSGLQLRWPPAIALFATALSSAGGWPLARLVIIGGGSVVDELRASGYVAEVPVVADRAAGRQALRSRPRRVRRSSGLPSGAAAPGFARELVRSACADWKVDDDQDRVMLVTSELVTNAVEHTPGRIVLTLSHDQRGLTISVRDGGRAAWAAATASAAGASVGSLGLRIVQELSDRWGVTPHGDGKTVWALIGSDQVRRWRA